MLRGGWLHGAAPACVVGAWGQGGMHLPAWLGHGEKRGMHLPAWLGHGEKREMHLPAWSGHGERGGRV